MKFEAKTVVDAFRIVEEKHGILPTFGAYARMGANGCRICGLTAVALAHELIQIESLCSYDLAGDVMEAVSEKFKMDHFALSWFVSGFDGESVHSKDFLNGLPEHSAVKFREAYEIGLEARAEVISENKIEMEE